jgi:glycosyltransferase involved in cell wall biosynthesis
MLATVWESDQERAALKDLESLGLTVRAERLTRPRAAANVLQALLTGRPMQSRYCWVPGLARQVQRQIQSSATVFDVVHVEHLRGAEYGWTVQGACARLALHIPVVWDSVDCISLLFEQVAHQSRSRLGRWIARIELPNTRRYEGRAVRQFDRVLASSKIDQAALEKLARTDSPRSPAGRPANPGGKVRVLPNGVDLDYFTPANEPRDTATVVLSGKMSYHANVAAAHRLIGSVMPHVWAQRPDVKVNIVGSAPTADVEALAVRHAPRVTVTGYVPDVRPYLQTATLAVAPLAYGAGIQNKVLEAMACATPIVVSSQAIAALEALPADAAQVADGAADFAAEMLRLLGDAQLRQAVGRAGWDYVHAHHDWSTIVRGLEAIYDELLPPPA